MKHVRDLKITYTVVEVYYNESRSNCQEDVAHFTDVRDAVSACREYDKDAGNNTEYVVIVDWE